MIDRCVVMSQFARRVESQLIKADEDPSLKGESLVKSSNSHLSKEDRKKARQKEKVQTLMAT